MTEIVVAPAYGGPEVLRLAQADVTPPGPGEVLLEVRAAGVNPVDYKVYSGMMGSDLTQLPLRLGLEASGVVRAVGSDAEGPAGPVAVGDEVIAYRISGAYAGEVVVSATALVPRPDALGWEAAAGLMLTGATAIHTLTATGVGAGDTVLIHAASGGVGLMGVQIAIDRGARVIGTASEASHQYLRRLGAVPVAYGEGLGDRVRALAPEGIDAAIDNIGTDEAIDVSLELVSDRSRIATIAAPGRGFEAGIKVLGGAPGADPGVEVRSQARLELVRLVRDGKLEVQVDRTYPLASAAAAHRYVATGHVHGKVVLVVG
jgi:NADPH:quinone reductase-like Zn-dependent oxidoreductase